MASLHSILTIADIMKMVPLYVAIAFGVIAGIAFIVGFVKGFRKVKWGGFYWALASFGFILAYEALAPSNIFKGKFAGVGMVVMGETVELVHMEEFLWAFIIALGCILVSLILYGIFTKIFRPRAVWVREKEIETDEYGFEYEYDDEDDTYEDGVEIRGKKLIIRNGGKPKFISRVVGGLLAAIHVTMIMATIISIFLLFVNVTALKKGFMGHMFAVEATQVAVKLVATYALDFFMIGILFRITRKGYQNGFLTSLLKVIISIGTIVIVVGCFIIPFTNLQNYHFFNVIIDRSSDLFSKMKPEYASLFGKLLAGLVMAIIARILLAVINFFLKKLIRGVSSIGLTRGLDGILGAILFMILGVVIWAVIWMVLYALDYCGLFYVRQMFDGQISLAKEFFDVVGEFVKPFADKYLLQFKA